MKKIIIEVGSTSTKFDEYDGKKIKRLITENIEFKRNYKKENKLCEEDITRLVNKVNEYKSSYEDVYVCGTSIFRSLTDIERESFLKKFKNKTGIEFEIITQEKEIELTVKGTIKNIKDKVAVFVGGGGSTEIAICKNGIIETANTKIGVTDIMNKYPDLSENLATTELETIKKIVRENLNFPKQKSDILILTGGGHLNFALNSGVNYEKNNLYNDDFHPIMMDIETRKIDTVRYYKEISLDDIRKRVKDPDWWYSTRAMCAFVLVVAEEIGAKYIIPTDISLAQGLINN